MSRAFLAGRMTRLMPPRSAATAFSLMPPTTSTRPRSVISPVMATAARVGRSVNAEISAVAMVIPADGPSLGVAPSGMWMWMSTSWWNCSCKPSRRALDRA